MESGGLEFDTDTTGYLVNVLQSVTSVRISVFASDYRATITVDGARIGPEFGTQISLVEGEDRDIPVVVTAEDGVTTETYTVTVVQIPVTSEEEGEGT